MSKEAILERLVKLIECWNTLAKNDKTEIYGECAYELSVIVDDAAEQM